MGELTVALDSYREWLEEDEERARVTLTVPCELVRGVEVEAEVGKHVVKVDEPRTLGGGGTAPNPVNYALVALGSCTAIGLGYWSDRLGISFDSVRVVAEGDLDVRGNLGFEEGVKPSFNSVRMTIHIVGSESAERYDELTRTVSTYSPLLELFTSETPVTTTLEVDQ